jgi:hypothetical protein
MEAKDDLASAVAEIYGPWWVHVMNGHLIPVMEVKRSLLYWFRLPESRDGVVGEFSTIEKVRYFTSKHSHIGKYISGEWFIVWCV